MKNIELEPGEKARVRIKGNQDEYEINTSAKKSTAQMPKVQSTKDCKKS